MIDAEEYRSRGRARQPALYRGNIAVVAFEPKPLLVGEVVAPKTLIQGAWTFTTRKVLGLSIAKHNQRLAYAISAADLLEAVDIMREKDLPPASWIAWVALKRHPNARAPVTLASVINLPWLREGRRRAWFRTETKLFFGGRARIVGDPPPQGSSELEVAAYQSWAVTEKTRLESSWAEANKRGALFPNADYNDLKGKV